MAFSEFLQCCSSKNERFGEAIAGISETSIRSLLRAWGGLTPVEKQAVLAAADFGAAALGVALAGLGVAAAEVVAVALLGVGLGAAMEIAVSCGRQWL